MTAAASKNEEKNVVGDQRNWEQRVTSELEVAKAWCDSWGPLYKGATTQQQQLESLEENLQRWVSPGAVAMRKVRRWHQQ